VSINIVTEICRCFAARTIISFTGQASASTKILKILFALPKIICDDKVCENRKGFFDFSFRAFEGIIIAAYQRVNGKYNFILIALLHGFKLLESYIYIETVNSKPLMKIKHLHFCFVRGNIAYMFQLFMLKAVLFCDGNKNNSQNMSRIHTAIVRKLRQSVFVMESCGSEFIAVFCSWVGRGLFG